MLNKILLAIVLLIIPAQAMAATYYVKSTGGTNTECTGTNPAAYPGSGTGQACAFKNYYYALGWYGDRTTGGQAGSFSGGDTLIFLDSTFAGYDSQFSTCSTAYPYGCVSRPVPGGSDSSHRTKLYGANYLSCDDDLSNTTELWGKEQLDHIFNLAGNDHIELKCLNITDRDNCISNLNGNPPSGVVCRRASNSSYPLGNWATNGIYSGTGSPSDIVIDHTNIHGLVRGVFATSKNNWTVSYTHISFNSSVAWDNDTDFDSASTRNDDTGAITLSHVTMQYNGCGEVWDSPGTPFYCAGQDQGGYGDTITSGGGQSADVTITDSNISFNTSDAIDNLYSDGTSDTMVVARTLFQGDAGNSIKSSAHSNYVENNLILGNCAYFKNQSFTAMNKEQTGRSGTACNYDGTCQATENNTNCHWNDSNGNGGIDPGEGDCAGFNNCRANGDTVTFNIRVPNQTAILTGNTIYGNSNILLFVEGTADVCGSLTLRSRNNIYVGGIEHNDGADFPDFFYSQGPGTCNNINLNTDYDIIYHTNHIATDCTDTGNGGHNTCTNTDPGFVGPVPIGTNYFTGSNFDQSFYLLSTSIARGATKADETVTCADNCAVDYNGYSRGAQWDAGALQYGSVPTGATCSTSCSLCLTQGTCAASPITCYWWTDSSCHSSQEPEVCGNGITVSPETCDDGNTTDGDCCSSICETETSGLERFLQTSRWTESDPSSHLTVTTHKVVVSGQDRNSSTSLVYDGGASHFGDFTTRMKVDWTNCTSTTCTLAVWALSSTLRSNLSAMQSASDGVFLALYQQPAGGTPPNSYVWYVQDATNAGNYAGFADSTPPVSRYVQITRSGTTVTVSVYTDSSYTTLVTASGNPIVLTVPATAYRYLYTAMSRNDGFTDAQINATIQDLNIGESTLSCGSGGAVCGNSTCETGETSINCPADCTTPQTTSQTGGFAGKGKLTGNGRAK